MNRNLPDAIAKSRLIKIMFVGVFPQNPDFPVTKERTVYILSNYLETNQKISVGEYILILPHVEH